VSKNVLSSPPNQTLRDPAYPILLSFFQPPPSPPPPAASAGSRTGRTWSGAEQGCRRLRHLLPSAAVSARSRTAAVAARSRTSQSNGSLPARGHGAVEEARIGCGGSRGASTPFRPAHPALLSALPPRGPSGAASSQVRLSRCSHRWCPGSPRWSS
jgi:hypothetical protein